MEIRFSRHAELKLELLKKLGFDVNREMVEKVLRKPEKIESKATGEQVAQARVSDRHLLRVVFREEGDVRRVITMYPARRNRYED